MEWLRSAVLPMGRSKGDKGFVFRDGTGEGRLALDLLREKQARGRVATTKAFHEARAV